MTFQILDEWSSPHSRFLKCYKEWCVAVSTSSRNLMNTPDFFTWIMDTFPDIIGVEEDGRNDLYITFKYTFESEAHFTLFLLKQ